MNNSAILSSLLLILFFSVSCSNSSTNTDPSEEVNSPEEATITLDNMGSSAYVILQVDGNGASAEIDEENAALELKSGHRYHFENEAGADSHPLNFRNEEGDKLIGQGNGSGIFDDDRDVNLSMEGNRISFTLTTELASMLAEYICAFHPSMKGEITITD